MQIFSHRVRRRTRPRAANTTHNLAELLMIAFLAVLCGAHNCSEMVTFGRTKLDFIKRFLCLKNGIPSHDTFSAVFRTVTPKALNQAFGDLTAALVISMRPTPSNGRCGQCTDASGLSTQRSRLPGRRLCWPIYHVARIVLLSPTAG